MNNSAAQNVGMEPDLDTYRDMTVGEILRRTREYYGQTLPQVEINLRIRASQLQALEQGDVSQLPGRVYAIGFVRAYSEYLGLDGDKMVHLFKAQSVGRGARPDLQFPVAVHESKIPNIPILIGCMVGLVILITVISIFYAPAKNEETIPPVPQILVEKRQAMMNPATQLAVADEIIIIEEEPALQEPKVLELVAIADSWVEIKDDAGKLVLRKVLKPGQKYVLPEGATHTVSTGNAGGLAIYLDGEKIRVLGNKAEVKRNIALSLDDFVAE